jgi:AcrR family transcriptional regulator
MQNRRRRPFGRDEVVAAIQAAAIELLAEHGPRELTVRAIAARAGVNHALVHRHFGTKDDLIRTVLASESAAIAEAAGARQGTAAMLGLLEEHRGYFRALARAVLDSPTALAGTAMPAATAFLRLVGEPDERTRGAAAAAGALALGWLVFGEHLAAGLGAGSPDTLRAPVVAAIESLTRPRAGSRRPG